MGSARRFVPPGKGIPIPDPPNAWDTDVVEGPNWPEITGLLDELTEIVEVDWAYRHLIPRRNDIFIRLRELGVTTGRILRAYAIKLPDGTHRRLFTHVGINGVLKKAGVPVGEPFGAGTRPEKKTTEQEEPTP